jgi:hypothetical protein
MEQMDLIVWTSQTAICIFSQWYVCPYAQTVADFWRWVQVFFTNFILKAK